ncbi:unnamed protein product, partial [Ectocarpus sp. 12 AP-2014]
YRPAPEALLRGQPPPRPAEPRVAEVLGRPGRQGLQLHVLRHEWDGGVGGAAYHGSLTGHGVHAALPARRRFEGSIRRRGSQETLPHHLLLQDHRQGPVTPSVPLHRGPGQPSVAWRWRRSLLGDRQQGAAGNRHGERQLLLLGVHLGILHGEQLPEVSHEGTLRNPQEEPRGRQADSVLRDPRTLYWQQPPSVVHGGEPPGPHGLDDARGECIEINP